MILKFQNTTRTILTRDAVDLEFWDKYAKHDKGLYYIYQLFHDKQNKDCLLLDTALSRMEIPLDVPATGTTSSTTGLLNQSSVQINRSYFYIL